MLLYSTDPEGMEGGLAVASAKVLLITAEQMLVSVFFILIGL